MTNIVIDVKFPEKYEGNFAKQTTLKKPNRLKKGRRYSCNTFNS